MIALRAPHLGLAMVVFAVVLTGEGEGPAAYDPDDWATADNYRYTVTLNN